MRATRIAAIIALAVAGTGFAATPAMADPPPWAPAHGWRAKHHYVYYPSADVYYAPATRMWFWLGGNGWRTGVSLPIALQGFARVGGVNIHLDVARPYLRNAYVVRRYGGHPHRWSGDDDDYEDYYEAYYHGCDDDDDCDRPYRWHGHHGDDDNDDD